MRIEVYARHPEPRKIRLACEALRRGDVIAYPTDTIYGLGCDVQQKRAIDELYRIRRLDKGHPLAFICPDLSDIARYAVVDDRAYRVMKSLLPGAYTFVLHATREVPRMLMQKRRTIGIRVPDHPVPLAIVRELGNPIVSASAVIDDEPVLDPEEIDARFAGLGMVLDGGFGGAQPSTILDLTGPEPVVVREGAGDVSWLR